MAFQTQKHFLGKDQTLLHAEIESERLISIVRLCGAALFGVSALFSFLLGSTALKPFLIQAGALVIVFIYSIYFLLRPEKRIFHGYFLYIVLLLDITVITVILWSYRLNGVGTGIISSSAASLYFIVIIFTAFHHKTSLSIFCGVLSIAAYSILYFIYMKGTTTPRFFGDFPLRIVLLITAAFLGSIVSRNNSRTIQQVISSETRYHSLVHRLPEMLFTLDNHGNFIWANTAASTILGVPSKTLPGRSLRSFLSHPESFKLDSGGVRGTFGITDFQGNEKFVDCIIQPVTEEDGKAAFDGIMSDVTDRERAISQREEMVQRLFQYQKMESLGMLASGMAHDFNNILQTVNDICAMIQRESKEEDTLKRIELINETMADAKFLINELFALGRKKPLDYRRINLNSLLEQIIPQFSKQLGPNFLVTLETPEEPLYIEGDPDHLKRVFQNLIGNARDAMPEGGNITVSCEKALNASNEGIVNIRVIDTGTGIPPELTEKVFDPFFTTKKPGKGTGLGLALVRRIVMLHNGTITIEKTGYEGTVFLIQLPISDEKSLDSDTKAFMMNRLPTTVLLLDDDRKIREVLKIFLKELKYSVLEATNCEEAVEVLTKNIEICRVMIMDWKLGNEDPHYVIKRLRLIRPDLIVIVLSGYPAQQESIERMRIARWVTKPYDSKLLDIEIQRALHKAQAKKQEQTEKENTESVINSTQQNTSGT